MRIVSKKPEAGKGKIYEILEALCREISRSNIQHLLIKRANEEITEQINRAIGIAVKIDRLKRGEHGEEKVQSVQEGKTS